MYRASSLSFRAADHVTGVSPRFCHAGAARAVPLCEQ